MLCTWLCLSSSSIQKPSCGPPAPTQCPPSTHPARNTVLTLRPRCKPRAAVRLALVTMAHSYFSCTSLPCTGKSQTSTMDRRTGPARRELHLALAQSHTLTYMALRHVASSAVSSWNWSKLRWTIACMQIQHFYADAPNFPDYLHAQTVEKYVDMSYHYSVLKTPRSQDVVLDRDRIMASPLHLSPHHPPLPCRLHTPYSCLPLPLPSPPPPSPSLPTPPLLQTLVIR